MQSRQRSNDSFGADSISRTSTASREEQLAARRKAIEEARRRNDELSRKIELTMAGWDSPNFEDTSSTESWSSRAARDTKKSGRHADTEKKKTNKRQKKTEPKNNQRNDSLEIACSINIKWVVLSIILLLIAGGIVAYFMLTKSAKSDPMERVPALEEDCGRVSSGTALIGQEALTQRSFDVILDVKMEEFFVGQNEITVYLESQIQKILMPMLVGYCDAKSRKLRSNIIDPDRFHHQFIVANGKVHFPSASLQKESECAPQMCLSATFNLDLFLRTSEEKFKVVINRVEEVFKGELVDLLELEWPFKSVLLRSVINLTPTVEPSSRPTMIPSVPPTQNPTESPSNKPTDVPSATPSRRPTTSPTPRPTLGPTVAPTPKPTPPPTNAPSESPSTSSNPTGEFDGYFEPLPRPIRVACAGDSLTRGRQGGYPLQLQEMLGNRFDVYNFGRNAMTALRGLSVSYVDQTQFQSSLDFEPDIYLLMLGTNDVGYWETHGHKYQEDMEWIVNKVRSSNSMESPARIIVAIPPWIKTDGAFGLTNNILVDGVQPAIQTVAALEDLELVNMYDVTYNQVDFYRTDGLHFNSMGYTSLATAWKGVIECNQNGFCEVGENCETCPDDCYWNCEASLSPSISPRPTTTSRPTKIPTIVPIPTAAPTISFQPTSEDQLRPGNVIGSIDFAIGKCQSGCTSDSHCQFGLVCFERNPSQSSVPGCIGDATQVGDGTKSFCIEPPDSNTLVVMGQEGQPSSFFPLGKCQGNCEQDSDCREGLKCFWNDDSLASLGCSGKGIYGLNYCFPPPEGEKFLEFIGNYEMDWYELSTCQGDCDYDSDCALGHVCYYRDAGDSGEVPGCYGNANTIGFGNDDYCIKRPAENYLSSVYDDIEGAVTSAYPIGRCSGDCDTDDDCAGSLVCFERLVEEPVPGCQGEGEEGYDYCIAP